MAQIGFQNFKILPEGIKNIIIINALMFVLEIILRQPAFNIDLIQLLALHPVNSPDYHFYQWITHMFMHANFPHILFNMFGLWMFGYTLENVVGTKKFLMLYFTAGLVAAATEMIINSYSGTNVSMLGASGAVYGVMAAFALLYPNTTVYFYFFLPIKIKYFIPLLFAFDFWGGITGTDNIAHFAHLGGGVAGLLMAYYWKQNGIVNR